MVTGRRFHELVEDTLAASEIAADVGAPIATVLQIARRLGRLPIEQQVRLSGGVVPERRTAAPAAVKRSRAG